jgi:hypothetical protein
MAHFAKLDENNIVETIVVIDNSILDDGTENENEQQGIDYLKEHYGSDTNWVQCSFNNNIRKQFAGIGWSYDEVNDIFIRPQPYSSWVLNDNFEWEAPIADPNTPNEEYIWDEKNNNWKLINTAD